MKNLFKISSIMALLFIAPHLKAQIVYPFTTVYSPPDCEYTYQIDIQLSLDSVQVTDIYSDGNGPGDSFAFEGYLSYNIVFSNSTLPPGDFYTFQPTLYSDNVNLNSPELTNNIGTVPVQSTSAGGFASQNRPTYTGSASGMGLELGKYYSDIDHLTQLGYLTATLHINLPCLDTTMNADGGGMPVTWTALKASASGKEVTLAWQTLMERSSSYYDIQKSTDAKIWNSQGQIPTLAKDGSSDMLLNYTYKMSEELAGKYYYRVIQNDIDGKTTTSRIVSVNLLGTDANSILVYPNPAENEINLTKALPNTAYVIYNSSGRSVQRGEYSSNIDVSKLTPGIYTVKTLGKSSRLVVK